MAYLSIDNFSGGVDRRRPIYASTPGTLWSGINCHITRGGDIEKRFAFADLGDMTSQTFGLVDGPGDTIYTFGTAASVAVPGNVVYQQLSHPDGLPMAAILSSELFNGKLYVIAQYADGSIYPFYDGVIVADWVDGIVRSTMTNNSGIAAALAALINASPSYIATSAGAVITVTAQTAGVPFSVTTFAANKTGGVDDQTLTNVNITPNVTGVTGVAASFTFQVTAGDGAGQLTVLSAGGVSLLGGAITWATSNMNTASLIATSVNLGTGSHGWIATTSGQTVILTKNVTGTVHNNLTVAATTTATFRINNLAAGSLILGSTAGGVDAVASTAQVNQITVGGTFEVGDRFGVTLTSTINGSLVASYFGNTGKPSGAGTYAKTHKEKMYAASGSLVNFSAVNNAILWNSDVDVGAGFINASTHAAGSQSVVSLETYQGFLSLFSRRTVQLWQMENDDTLNEPRQILKNTGTRAPRSVLEYGGRDVFYLDDPGIRSLQARQSSDLAQVATVGIPIDTLIRDYVRSEISDAEAEAAVSAIEPLDGRFWLGLGRRIFVYSFFPESKVSAWSWYELAFRPTDFAVSGAQIYVRGDDNHLYLWGGTSGEEFGDDYEVTAWLPFASMQKDGTSKDFYGIGMLAEGEWEAEMLINPNNLYDTVQYGSNDGVTTAGDSGTWDGLGSSPFASMRMTHQGDGLASISKILLFYSDGEVKN